MGHRRFRDEEGARQAVSWQSTQRPERERHLRIEGERRVATGEEQLEPLVRDRRVVSEFVHLFGNLEELRLLGKGAVAADTVDRAVARGRDQPRPRVRRRAIGRPASRRERERLLDGILGEVEVAEEADQEGEDARPLLAVEALELAQRSTTGRTSTEPPIRAAGTRAAISSAASRSSASSM